MLFRFKLTRHVLLCPLWWIYGSDDGTPSSEPFFLFNEVCPVALSTYINGFLRACQITFGIHRTYSYKLLNCNYLMRIRYRYIVGHRLRCSVAVTKRLGFRKRTALGMSWIAKTRQLGRYFLLPVRGPSSRGASCLCRARVAIFSFVYIKTAMNSALFIVSLL